MKKFLTMMAVAMMTALSVNAQSAGEMFIKPMVGATLSTFTSVDHSKMKFGFVGGAEYGYYVADPVAITAGLLVAMQGSGYEDSKYDRDKTSTSTMINVPILVNYYIAKGLALKVGVQPGFLVGNKIKGEADNNGKWESYESTETDGLKKFDFSIPVGLSYEISDFVIDARYNFGLTKVADYSDAKNSVIMLTLGYKIPF